jgi:hypothetical protein
VAESGLNAVAVNVAAVNATVADPTTGLLARRAGIAGGGGFRGLSRSVTGEGGLVQMLATVGLVKAIVAAMVAATGAKGPLNDAHVGLFTGQPSLDPGTVVGDLVEPTYAGYARQALDPAAWEPPSVQTDGSVATMNCGCIHFRMTDNLAPTSITGVFLADAAGPGGNLLASGALDSPYALIATDQSFDVLTIVGLPQNLVLGSPLLFG